MYENHSSSVDPILNRIVTEFTLGENDVSISPIELFDAFAHAQRSSLRTEIENLFEIVGLPGELIHNHLQEGDVIIRSTLGEGDLAFVSVVALPELWSYEQLAGANLLSESDRSGYYVQVIESGPRPHRVIDSFARRLLDADARLPKDSIVLRVMHQPEVSASSEFHIDETSNEKGDINLIAEVAKSFTADRFKGDPVLLDALNDKKHIKKGSKGSAVSKIQQALIDLGYALPVHGIDRDFGSETKKAVSTFQSEQKSIDPKFNKDGIVGPQTMERLDSMFAILDRPCGAATTGVNDPTNLNLAAPSTRSYNAGTKTVNGKAVEITGTVFYPAESAGSLQPFSQVIAAQGPAPIVFIAHGNHGTFHDPINRNNEDCTQHSGWIRIASHDGYHYFQEMLAKLGIISVSVDCHDSNCSGLSPTNIRLRSGMIVEAIRHFIAENAAGSGSFFEGLIDFDRTGLLGHSRGGEAVLVVPGDLAAGGAIFSGVRVKGVISLAPTDIGTLSVMPTGFPFMTILPAGDGDVVNNTGARFYDRIVSDPFKCQLYIHRTNHNRFNREWPVDDPQSGPPVISDLDHERILSVYGAAFFRQALFGVSFSKILMGEEHPPGVPNDQIHISAEQKAFTTVDDQENSNIDLNTLGETTIQAGTLTATEEPLSQSPVQTNRSFFGLTDGMIGVSTAANGTFRSPLGTTMDLTGREVWFRAAEIYKAPTVPAGATQFQIGLEDSTGKVAFVGSGELPRPYDRRAQDICRRKDPITGACIGTDFTKSMLKTIRFPANCFKEARPVIDLSKIQAIVIRLHRVPGRKLAFDQLQITV